MYMDKEKKMSENVKLKGLKIHQIKDSLVGIIDKDNKLIAQGRRFLGGAISWTWIRKDYQ
jgi:hypothetical protein